MKGAYGDGIDPTRSYPGLDVIAQALNQGDIGRAMIAAIQLRLPNLNVEGAAQIAYVDQALKKYNPNEPRDEHGRWTTGDGSPSTTPKSPDLGHGGMQPILVSDFEDPHDPRILPSLLVNMTLSRECIGNAKEPRYYEKTMLCQDVLKQCNWLIEANKNSPFRRDACFWPDGSAAIMKFGVLVPFRVGHPF
jgi:hypothetical protein